MGCFGFQLCFAHLTHACASVSLELKVANSVEAKTMCKWLQVPSTLVADSASPPDGRHWRRLPSHKAHRCRQGGCVSIRGFCSRECQQCADKEDTESIITTH
eukprot:4838770-Amphidinium_carterae.1